MTAKKIIPIEEIAKCSRQLRKEGRRIVLCHGAFDLMHSGHIRYLQRAKQEGDILLVTVTADAFVNKGPGRPLVSYRERAQILAGLECVDYVTVFDELTPIAAIEAIRPDILAKGGNYAIDEIVGKSLVEQYGGQVLALNTEGSYDTADFMIAVSRASTGKRDL